MAMIAVGLLAAHLCTCAALLSRPAWARRLAVAVGVAAVPLVWMVPADQVVLRAVLALSTLWILAKLIDHAACPCTGSYRWRLWYLTSAFDVRLGRSAPRTVARGRLVVVAALAALTAAGAAAALALAPRLGGAPHYLARWGGGAVAFYAGVEATVATITLVHARLGVAIPVIQDAPILARSVGEFWSRRWNRPVSRWLRIHCFTPLARRGWPLAGLALAFVVSGYIHFHFVWAALGPVMAASMALFFVVQIPLVLAERALAVRSWPGAARRAWTLATLAAASPLFFEPMLRIVDAGVGG